MTKQEKLNRSRDTYHSIKSIAHELERCCNMDIEVLKQYPTVKNKLKEAQTKLFEAYNELGKYCEFKPPSEVFAEIIKIHEEWRGK